MSEQSQNNIAKGKSIMDENGLIKPLFKQDKMPDYSYPSHVALGYNGKVTYFPSQPMARRDISEDGTERILRKPLIKGDDISLVSSADIHVAMKNTAQFQEADIKRKIYKTLPSRLDYGNSYRNYQTTTSEYYVQSQPVIKNVLETFKVINSAIHIFDDSTQTYTLLCSYNLIPAYREYYYDNQELCQSTIMIDVHMNGIKSKQLRLFISEIDDIAKKVSDIIPEAYISYDVSQAGKKLAYYLRTQLNDLQIFHIQKSCGWLLWKGKYIFAHDNHIPVEDLQFLTGKKIAYQELPPREIAEIFLSIIKLATPKIIAPMLGTCLLGILNKLFTDASEEYSPRFVLAIIGKSGSLKTAVSKVLFSVYNTDSELRIPASFQDTLTSLEIRFKELPCVPILVDDYYNLGNAGKKGDMGIMLETLIRYMGDGIGKNRSNSKLENVKGNRPTGTMVLTGEATTGQHSMLLRCLTVYVDNNTFSGENLRVFQQNKTLITTLLYHFVVFLELNYATVVNHIADRFQVLYDECNQHFQDARPRYQYIQLQLAFLIFGQFLKQLTQSDVYEVSIAECINGCFMAVRDSQDFANRNASEVQYILVFYELLGKGQIRIADNKDVYQKSIHSYDGFVMNDFYWVSTSEIYIKIRKHLVQQGYHTLDENTATQTFFKAGLLDVETEQKKDGTSKTLFGRKITINGQRKRMLKISMQGLNDFIQENL